MHDGRRVAGRGDLSGAEPVLEPGERRGNVGRAGRGAVGAAR